MPSGKPRPHVRFVCWLHGHRLDRRVWIPGPPDVSVPVKFSTFVPMSEELLADQPPTFSAFDDYTLRCECGKRTDLTIRNVWKESLGELYGER